MSRFVPAVTALEAERFPASVSHVAEYESWRKELHRPATYVHKWWARRLGTVFRRVLLDAVNAADGPGAGSALTGLAMYDPFAGSGTTLVEAAKLGATVMGRDINPVATLTQRQGLAAWDFAEIERLFVIVEDQVRADIDALFVTSAGEPVMHYFWIAIASCPECSADVELFTDYVFAKHAVRAKSDRAHATCPNCHDVVSVTLGTDTAGTCGRCAHRFDLKSGPVSGTTMTCPSGHSTLIIDALADRAPRRRMFAKAVKVDGRLREYRPIDDFDVDLYERARKQLGDTGAELVVPDGALGNGTNTRQATNWGYRTWAQFFNDRQLYCLGRIGAALRDLPGDGPEREALIAAFGKTLEHHNVFCSFKGEGTGAVRSIFHNHVLRPERSSLEGNPWGEKGASGGYGGTLHRLRRAHEYKRVPTDIVTTDSGMATVSGMSSSSQRTLVRSWRELVADPSAAYIVTGDAAHTDIPTGSVALVVTDPPYVDNVHYSELADFFHAWMRPMRPHADYPQRDSTRDAREVQNTAADGFQAMISDVWRECARVLRDDGLLAFSFHQSQTAGWVALMASLADAGLVVTATNLAVAEVTTSLTKHAAAEPNRVDVIVVCRKQSSSGRCTPAQARADVMGTVGVLTEGGVKLGAGDVRTAVRAAVLAEGTKSPNPDWAALSAAADAEASVAVAQHLGLVSGSLAN
jgi:putative DNA methylase